MATSTPLLDPQRSMTAQSYLRLDKLTRSGARLRRYRTHSAPTAIAPIEAGTYRMPPPSTGGALPDSIIRTVPRPVKRDYRHFRHSADRPHTPEWREAHSADAERSSGRS